MSVMNGPRSLRRLAARFIGAACTAGLIVVAISPPARALQDTVVEQPFFADSGDSCQYGLSRGMLGWHLPPLGGLPAIVDVDGSVADRPLTTGPSICPDDRRFTSVTFTALSGRTVLESALVRADNDVERVELRLGRDTYPARMDRVVVQVCRSSPVGTPPTYCGTAQVYRAPLS
jgi:hypothetical protein